MATGAVRMNNDIDFQCPFCYKMRLRIDQVIGSEFCIYCLEGEEWMMNTSKIYALRVEQLFMLNTGQQWSRLLISAQFVGSRTHWKWLLKTYWGIMNEVFQMWFKNFNELLCLPLLGFKRNKHNWQDHCRSQGLCELWLAFLPYTSARAFEQILIECISTGTFACIGRNYFNAFFVSLWARLIKPEIFVRGCFLFRALSWLPNSRLYFDTFRLFFLPGEFFAARVAPSLSRSDDISDLSASYSSNVNVTVAISIPPW